MAVRPRTLAPAMIGALALACGLWFVDLYAFTFAEFWRGPQPDQWRQLPRSLGMYAFAMLAVTSVLAVLGERVRAGLGVRLGPALACGILLALACLLAPAPLDLWPAVLLVGLAAAVPAASLPHRTDAAAPVVAFGFLSGATLLLSSPAWTAEPLSAGFARGVGSMAVAGLLITGAPLVRVRSAGARRVLIPVWILLPFAVVLVLTSRPSVGGRATGGGFKGPPNLLVITGDTMRASSMSTYGGPAATPAFDTLAGRGMRTQRYYAAAPWTIPSLESFWTSRFPPGFSAQAPPSQRALELTRYSDVGEYFLPGPSIIDALAERGYQTTAFVTNPAMAFQDWLLHEFEQRIVTGVLLKHRIHGWVDSTPLLQGALVTLGAPVTTRPRDLTWLARRYASDYLRNIGDRPFVLWTHFVDPHTPYDPPKRFRSGPQVFDYLRHDEHPWKVKEFAGAARALYEGEISYVDEALGAIMDELAAQGLMENTYVVFSADHGEEIAERGGFGHGHTLFEEQVRVPFAIAGPGIVPGVIEEPVSAIDVVPTLAELLGLPASDFWRGRSWVKRLRGQQPTLATEPVFVQATGLLPASPEPLQAVIEGDLKLIRGIDTQRVRLFNLAKDPQELRNVAGQRPEDVLRMRRHLDAWTAGFPSTFAQFELPAPNQFQKSAMEGLRALGYAH